MPLTIESCPRPAPTTRCSISGQRRRQRAGAQQDREIVRLLDREAAGNLARAAEDRLADHRRGDHLVVEHDRERAPDVLLRHLREPARAVDVELEGDDRLAGALVEARLRVGQVFARHQDALFDHVVLSAVFGGAFQKLGLRRHASLLRLLGADRHVDQPERQLRGLADELDQALRIGKARHLHQNAVDTLPLDQRLDGAQFVDAAFDDLDRLLDRPGGCAP